MIVDSTTLTRDPAFLCAIFRSLHKYCLSEAFAGRMSDLIRTERKTTKKARRLRGHRASRKFCVSYPVREGRMAAPVAPGSSSQGDRGLVLTRCPLTRR